MMSPSEAIEAVYDNNLKFLKSHLRTLPDVASITDDQDNNLLHLSIILDRPEIFDYLLSLDIFDLEAPTKSDDTALSLCLTGDNDPNEDFALELINRGSNVHFVLYSNNSLLHLATQKHKFKVAEALIEKGLDVNLQNDSGSTPFHLIFHQKMDLEGVAEGVGMMMYYGADPNLGDTSGNIPFELAVMYDPSLLQVQESLMYYTFDSFSKYQMSVEVLLEILETKSKLFFKIVDFVGEIVQVKGVFFGKMHLFSIESEFLVPLVEKLDYFVKELLLEGPMVVWNLNPTLLENYEILLNSPLKWETVEFITQINAWWLIDKLDEAGIAPQRIFNLIFYFLTYGLQVYVRDLDIVYRKYGYCPLFKTLLTMEINTTQYMKADILPKLIYDVHLDLDTFLADPHDYSLKSLETLLDYWARPKLKDFCLALNVAKLGAKVETLPRVPLLVEFARDASRKFLVQRYNLEKANQLCSVLKWLPISPIHARILSLETWLYR